MVDAADAPEAHEIASRIRPEFVVAVEGVVERRQPGTENAKLETGAVELQARTVTILNEAKTPPFYINDPDATIDESLRLATATSTSAASRCSAACSCAAAWSRPSARSTTPTASSRSRPRT